MMTHDARPRLARGGCVVSLCRFLYRIVIMFSCVCLCSCAISLCCLFIVSPGSGRMSTTSASSARGCPAGPTFWREPDVLQKYSAKRNNVMLDGYLPLSLSLSLYIYIYIERERCIEIDKERERERETYGRPTPQNQTPNHNKHTKPDIQQKGTKPEDEVATPLPPPSSKLEL